MPINSRCAGWSAGNERGDDGIDDSLRFQVDGLRIEYGRRQDKYSFGSLERGSQCNSVLHLCNCNFTAAGHPFFTLAYIKSGKPVQILPDWAAERFPLYAYHHSRQHPPAKIRAFLDFVREIAA